MDLHIASRSLNSPTTFTSDNPVDHDLNKINQKKRKFNNSPETLVNSLRIGNSEEHDKKILKSQATLKFIDNEYSKNMPLQSRSKTNENIKIEKAYIPDKEYFEDQLTRKNNETSPKIDNFIGLEKQTYNSNKISEALISKVNIIESKIEQFDQYKQRGNAKEIEYDNMINELLFENGNLRFSVQQNAENIEKYKQIIEELTEKIESEKNERKILIKQFSDYQLEQEIAFDH